jgi:hypothetical protein
MVFDLVVETAHEEKHDASAADVASSLSPIKKAASARPTHQDLAMQEVQLQPRRDQEPSVRIFRRKEPWPYLNVGITVDIPDAADIEPHVGVVGFTGEQPYKLVLVGEKSSLEDVLGPIAESHGADLYLPTG